jgi:hypothetical protein
MVSTNLGVLYIALGTSFMGLMQFLLGLLALMYFMRIGFGNNAMW